MNLWNHQRKGIDAIDKFPGFGLWFDMGTGKTLTVLRYIAEHCVALTLITAPRNVVKGEVWSADAAKWGVAVDVREFFKGSTVKRAREIELLVASRKALGVTKPLVIVLNYESVWRKGLASTLERIPWNLLVLDESHRAKSPNGKVSRFLWSLSRQIRKRVALSGTPLPHSPLDAFAQYRILNASIFGTSVVAFRNRFAIMGGYENHQIVGWRNKEEFQKLFNSISITVRSEDVLDLPPTSDLWLWDDLEPTARRVYDDVKRESIAALGLTSGEFDQVLADLFDDHDATVVPSGGHRVLPKFVAASNALVRGLRLQQIAGGHVKPDGQDHVEPISTIKSEMLTDWLTDVPAEEPVVVFARFTAELARIKEVAQDCERVYLEISGRTDGYLSWKNRTGGEVLGVQIQAGGVGIDLSRTRFGVYWSTGHSLGDYLQSRKRIHRKGQERPVAYYHLGARKTVDETIAGVLKRREKLVREWQG